MISINGVEIKPTIFPDGTSQVWKLPEDLLQTIYKEMVTTIKWDFKSEAEFMHLCQLKTLLDTYVTLPAVINLDIPYLPYGRQDKRVENGSTFALHTFTSLINSLNFNEVHTIDAHNNLRANMIEGLEDHSPREYIQAALDATQASIMLFPDKGAVTRYSSYNLGTGWTYADKVRDQATGVIKNIAIKGKVKDLKVLIVDDLCDGGMTFKLVAEQAIKDGAKEVHLYVTHGIFSRGLETLRESGIQRVFTYKGEQPRVTIPLYDGGH